MAGEQRYTTKAGGAITPDSVTTTGEGKLPIDKTGVSTGTGTSFENLDVTNMDQKSLAALQALIAQLGAGGTKEQQVANAKREQTRQLVEGLLGAVSPQQAQEEGKALMALNMQQAMEKNMPAIQKAIEGAGTSASSMQGILSQQLARDAALGAGALGAEQAKAYAGQRSNLANTLEALTRPTNDQTNALLNALQVAKGAVTSTKRTGGSSERKTESSTQTQAEAPRTIAEGFMPSGSAGSSLAAFGPLEPVIPTYRELVRRSESPSFRDFLINL